MPHMPKKGPIRIPITNVRGLQSDDPSIKMEVLCETLNGPPAALSMTPQSASKMILGLQGALAKASEIAEKRGEPKAWEQTNLQATRLNSFRCYASIEDRCVVFQIKFGSVEMAFELPVKDSEAIRHQLFQAERAIGDAEPAGKPS